MSRSARRRQAVDDLSFDELALEIGGDVVDASDAAALTSGVGEEPAAVALEFEHPHEFVYASTARHL
eukprot:scaffold100558_cov87-Phaeocystis_antarctica.AAC.1